MKTYMKFGILTVAILGVLVWLAVGGIKETQTYFKTIPELRAMGDQSQVKRLRVGGFVEPGSVSRDGRDVHFIMVESEGAPSNSDHLAVVYSGIEPLPDTFKDHAQALAEGKLDANGVFHATKIQAKCASKYEAKPPQAPASHAAI
jgi:cytochrome c-type biogenesis protein CcmE